MTNKIHTTSNKIKGSSAKGEIYLLGNKYIEGSRRLSIDENKKIPKVEKYVDGIWQPSSFKTGASSLWVGERVGIAAAGHHIMTEDVDGHYHFHAHSKFNGQLSTSDARILDAYSYEARKIFQSDNTGTFLGTKFEFVMNNVNHVLSNNGYFQTDTTGATSPVELKVWEGTDDTGALIFDQTYPTSQFTSSSEIQLAANGYLDFASGENYFFRFESADNFSLKTNANVNFPWLAIDTINAREDDMLQTVEWISGENFEEDQWSIQDKKIYTCNTTGIQTGTFASNSNKWNVLSANSFSYETIIDDTIITIPENQQMPIHGTIDIYGTLNLNGTLALRE